MEPSCLLACKPSPRISKSLRSLPASKGRESVFPFRRLPCLARVCELLVCLPPRNCLILCPYFPFFNLINATQASTGRLWFARDPLGRRSLLYHKSTLRNPYFFLTSVSGGAHHEHDLDEVSTDSLYRINVRDIDVRLDQVLSSVLASLYSHSLRPTIHQWRPYLASRAPHFSLVSCDFWSYVEVTSFHRANPIP